MPWSIFSQGGGNGAALTWAQDFLQAANLPQTPTNVQFVYDWELSEGGGGKYNPLNQGPVLGNSSLTSTGPQYGGGAADFISYDAGLQGSVAYINYPAYSSLLAALKKGTSYSDLTAALWNSPWAQSHYGYGSGWNTSKVPGAATSLAGAPGPGSGSNAKSSSSPSPTPSSQSGTYASTVDWKSGLLHGFEAPWEWSYDATVGPIANAVQGTAGIVDGISQAASALNKIGALFNYLFSPSLWLRVGAFLVGMIALFEGVHFLKISLESEQ